MRWKASSVLGGQMGNRVKFAWLPVQVEDQIVWLETYVIIYSQHFQLKDPTDRPGFVTMKPPRHSERIVEGK